MSRRFCETWESAPETWATRQELSTIDNRSAKRGLVESPEQWRWSSFRWYSSGEVGPVRINDADILVMTIRPPAA
jgi:hypothetical protein